MKLRVKLCIVAAVLIGVCAANAQVGVYAMGSAGRLSGYPVTSFTGLSTVTSTNNNLWAYGGTFGIYDNFVGLGPLKLGADIRGFLQTSSANNNTQTNQNQLRGGLVGLRLAGSAPLIPFKPYVQAEIGGASTNFGVNSSNTGGIAYQVQAGADFTIFPHLDVRAEYGVGQFTVLGGLSTGSQQRQTLQQLGVGGVIRF